MDVEPGSQEAAQLRDESARLTDEWALPQAEYQRLILQARKPNRPEPRPWPEAEPARSH